jgi:hypothetical protein
LSRAGNDLGARCTIYIVAEIRGVAGAGLDGNLETELD